MMRDNLAFGRYHLGKYEAAFGENEIDETVLPSLTHENLKELGVTALGHRLKLLDAIAALRSDSARSRRRHRHGFTRRGSGRRAQPDAAKLTADAQKVVS
jgi:hypothetical protein